MSDTEQLRQQLLQQLDELRTRLERIRQTKGQALDKDAEEQALELENSEVEDDIEAVTLAEIDQIERVLARIDGGEYGICVDCGGPVGDERLKANPLALRCIECEEIWERKQAGL
ncbi:MAG: TraR/DksA family transcriptional regulator [Gammaproteobacteria bacterium]|nr:MAG: TraR/DksA family transcriptional regulator [Gammaproteobacteria bacterium]